MYTTPSGRRRVKEGVIPSKFDWTEEKARRVLVRGECSSQRVGCVDCEPILCFLGEFYVFEIRLYQYLAQQGTHFENYVRSYEGKVP